MLMNRSYRAPELLFGPTTYDPQAIDLWATGCVLAGFFTLKSITPDTDPLDGAYMEDMGASQSQTLFDCTYGDLGLAASIFGIFGSPTPDSWPVSSSHLILGDVVLMNVELHVFTRCWKDIVHHSISTTLITTLDPLITIVESWKNGVSSKLFTLLGAFMADISGEGLRFGAIQGAGSAFAPEAGGVGGISWIRRPLRGADRWKKLVGSIGGSPGTS
jgi:serine/threonine protein kinase